MIGQRLEGISGWMRFDGLLKIGQHFNCQRRNNVVVLVFFFLFNLITSEI